MITQLLKLSGLSELSGGVWLDTAVKSAALLLLAALLASALRRASAAARNLIWSSALAGVLALPLLALLLPSLPVPILPSLSDQTQTIQTSDTVQAEAGTNAAALIAQQPESGAATVAQIVNNQGIAVLPREITAQVTEPLVFEQQGFDWGAALLLVWLSGALMVLARLALGVAGIWRLTQCAERLTDDEWFGLAQRLGATMHLRRVELFQSAQITLPMTWGWWRAAVLLPAEADEWSDACRRVVLLHELTHIKRRDCLMQTLAQLACAIYWFNPLVWLAARKMREERELACDDHVLAAGTKASDYAGSLVEVARALSLSHSASPVAVGMACSQLESRVRAILNPRLPRRGVNRWSVALASGVAVCLIVPLAMLRPAHTQAIAPAELSRFDQAAPSTPSTAPTTAIAPTTIATIERVATVSVAQTRTQTEERSDAEQGVGQGEGQATGRGTGAGDGAGAGQGSGQGAGQGSGQGTGQGAGQGRSSELSVEQLIELKSAGVTPEFIESMRKLGYDNLSARQLAKLRAQGINEDFIKQARSWSSDTLSVDDLVRLRVSGLSSDYINAMKRAGYDNLPIKQLADMRLQGVTPEYVEAMRRLGYNNLTPPQLTNLRALGVTESFVKEAQGWGLGQLSVDDLKKIRAMGITPDFARTMKALGYDNLSLDKLAELKALGVNESYVREMRELGFNNLSLEQVIKMKAVGVTPDYVRKLRAAGLKNTSINQLIEMRATGIDKILVKENR